MSSSESKAETPAGAQISTPSALRSLVSWIASKDRKTQEAFLNELGEGALTALPFLFEAWALPHQLPPDGAWRTWVIMGGRGAGKTRAGAEWVRQMVEGQTPHGAGRAARVALIGETYDQARDVMVFGESGILACAPPDRKPNWVAGRRRLVWPNGAEATVFSGHDPEALRGPQFDAAWVDELAKWKDPEAAWDMLQFGLRLGEDPRAVVTTTPRNSPFLKDLLGRETTVITQATTMDNAANLAGAFLEEVHRRYGGTRLGRQELEGVLLEEEEGALWSRAQLERGRVQDVPPLDRIVVAVDPSVSGKAGSDMCGIIVAGACLSGPAAKWRAYVLEDASVSASAPDVWAKAALEACARWDAAQIVAEVNQGGALVETVLRQFDPHVPYRAVHASKGKSARAEPIAALYAQDKVSHVRGLGALEDQMVKMTVQGFQGTGSPDRVDALVWALHTLMIAPSRPRVRTMGR